MYDKDILFGSPLACLHDSHLSVSLSLSHTHTHTHTFLTIPCALAFLGSSIKAFSLQLWLTQSVMDLEGSGFPEPWRASELLLLSQSPNTGLQVLSAPPPAS